MSESKIVCGDNLEVLKTFADNSIDSIVTDPPYGLSFMGKKWDYDVPDVELWRECLRVLKPGGHLLAFGGTRTYHRLVVAIEDSGFEIRDQLQWIYGSGFPKSLNVSKAIDKEAGAAREVIKERFKNGNMKGANGFNSIRDQSNQKSECNLTAPATDLAKQWDGWGTALKPANEIICLASKPMSDVQRMWYSVHSFGVSLCQSLLPVWPVTEIFQSSLNASNEALNTVQWNVENAINTLVDLCAKTDTLLSEPLTAQTSNLSIALLWNAILADLLEHANTFTTEMVSSLTIDLKTLKFYLLNSTQNSIQENETQDDGILPNAEIVQSILSAVNTKLTYIRMFSAIDDATSKENQKNFAPNSEPICLARKPISEKNVAQNVVKWGTGAINIDATRITGAKRSPEFRATLGNVDFSGSLMGAKSPRANIDTTQGRWPANVLFDEDAAEMLDEQSGILKSGLLAKHHKVKGSGGASGFLGESMKRDGFEKDYGGDSGGASRFFYVAKASKSERNKGCENLEPKLNDFQRESSGLSTTTIDGVRQKGNCRQPNNNHHPTVKPIKLMEYLCKLITPPGGTVLDPFMGSGTTGIAAKNIGFDFVGIEIEEEYFRIAKLRIENCFLSLERKSQ